MFLSSLSPRSDEGLLHPIAHLIVSRARQAHPRRLANAFQTRRDVDAVAHQVAVALLDDIAQVDADTKLDTLVRRNARVALAHRALDFDRAAHRVDHTAEFDDNSITRAFHNAATMHGDDCRSRRFAPTEPRKRAVLVHSRQTAKPADIGRQDRCYLALAMF
jgi:hypothetical protein